MVNRHMSTKINVSRHISTRIAQNSTFFEIYRCTSTKIATTTTMSTTTRRNWQKSTKIDINQHKLMYIGKIDTKSTCNSKSRQSISPMKCQSSRWGEGDTERKRKTDREPVTKDNVTEKTMWTMWQCERETLIWMLKLLKFWILEGYTESVHKQTSNIRAPKIKEIRESIV